jgi:DNA-binding MarR family transcriptional regulator
MRRLEDELKTNKFQNDVQKAHLNILFTACFLRARINERLKPFKITPEQYNVLRIIRGQYPMGIRVKDISDRMLDRNSNVTRIIDRLEHKKILLRMSGTRDRREKSVALTQDGLDLLLAIDKDWEKNSPHHCIGLTTEDAHRLNELLDSVRNF